MKPTLLKKLTLAFFSALAIVAALALALALRPSGGAAQAVLAGAAGSQSLETVEIQPAAGVLPGLQAAPGLPIFRNPVVSGATISGYFDHSDQAGIVTFYNGRRNQPGAGFRFQCGNPYMNDWVGCADNVSGEGACRNSQELWYDGHHGTDYEFASDWHTGAYCDLNNNYGLTKRIYAPAAGRIFMAGYDGSRPGNGWHIRMQHDLNHNGSYADDTIRSVYLHFTANALAVSYGQIVKEGDYLGLGGTTGYSSSPHLHFEVQRFSSDFSYMWPVDPYGWSGSGADPYGYENVVLWRVAQPVPQPYRYSFPLTYKIPACDTCGEVLVNGGFEDGSLGWTESAPGIVVNTSSPDLSVTPASGTGLARFGGRNDAIDSLNQDFEVPTGISRARLRYWVLINSEETGGASDYFYVRVRLQDGTVIQEMDMLDNTAATGQWVLREFNLPSLPPRGGEMLRINFKGATGAASPTTFYLDEVSITASQ